MSLERFMAAQGPVWADVERELKAGRKESHWMWFVFPQLQGLGRSATARYYALCGLAEAAAYLAHPVLGARLRQAASWILAHRGQDPAAILGPVDSLKLLSSMTLFERVDPSEPLFPAIIDEFYGGRRCGRTTAALAEASANACRSGPTGS
jgi:uncharacterized protein (DUF1810 family)